MDEKLAKTLKEQLGRITTDVDYCGVRYHEDDEDYLSVRQNILQPLQTSRDRGIMFTVHKMGGIGYGATSDLSSSGIASALAVAQKWAEQSGKIAVTNFSKLQMPHPSGEFHSPVKTPWEAMTLSEKVDRLTAVSRSMKTSPNIVDWSADLWRSRSQRWFFTSGGGSVYQDLDRLTPMLRVTANEGAETQTRTLGGISWCRQQGLELLDLSQFLTAGPQLADEALQLLSAPNCPSDTMDLLLAPDQMILQIHESIGHPLELDRILGDERNYAGTSFVTLDMFGQYRYGSNLLNVTYDPSRPEQAASFSFDDDGTAAKKEYVIKDGILLRPLGGIISQQRAGIDGVANTRADSWRRPAIDRMANLNVEEGSSSFDEMLNRTENGILMRTNCSWSIDDSRNKFQFGCEWAQLVEGGKLTKVVKKPNYRGISASFWRSLKMVGDASTHEVLGTPYCGKGEPNQAVFVGHASPMCLFENVDVFGGE